MRVVNRGVKKKDKEKKKKMKLRKKGGALKDDFNDIRIIFKQLGSKDITLAEAKVLAVGSEKLVAVAKKITELPKYSRSWDDDEKFDYETSTTNITIELGEILAEHTTDILLRLGDDNDKNVVMNSVEEFSKTIDIIKG